MTVDLSELPEVARVERLALKPGDRLVLTFRQHLEDADYDVIREHVRNWGLPPGQVIILDGGASLRVLEAS